MARTFNLEVVTPERSFYQGEVEMVVARTLQGDEAYMADHMWTVAPLIPGVLKIKEKDQIKRATCTGGFIHVKEEKVTIVADAVEWPEEINLNRAMEAKKRAESRLESQNQDIDFDRARASLMRAMIRINLKQEFGNK